MDLAQELLLKLIAAYQPIKKVELEYFVEMKTIDDCDGFSREDLELLVAELGPRPRRQALYRAVGDLYDRYWITNSDQGFTLGNTCSHFIFLPLTNTMLQLMPLEPAQ